MTVATPPPEWLQARCDAQERIAITRSWRMRLFWHVIAEAAARADAKAHLDAALDELGRER